MAVLPEDDTYPAGIYRIETTDPVLGGAPNEGTKAGLANIPTMQLAKRTHWLKTRVDQLLGKCVAATTSVAGLVTLSTSTNSTATDRAATPSAVKAAYDLASACYNSTNLGTAFPSQLGDTGWQSLPSGLVLQWGRSSVNASADGEVQITFPVAFPQHCCGIIGMDISNINNKSVIGVADVTATGARLTWALVTGTSHRGIRWIAIGY